LNILPALWHISLTLSLIALVIVTGLIVARFISELLQKRRAAERQRLIPLLLGGEASGERSHIAAHAPNTLTNLAIELIQMVRGTDREKFIENARELGVPDRLRHRMDSGSPRSRLEAAEALAEFGDPKSLQRLKAALDDSNSDVRLAAAVSLAAAGAAPPASELVAKLRLGTVENSRLIVSLFREIAKSRPEEIRELILAPQYPASVKAAAIEALSTSGDYSLVPIIADLVVRADPGDEALPRYLRALGALGHPAAAEAVEYGMDNTEWRTRAAAAEAAGQVSLFQLAPRLADLLDDSSWWVRFKAGEALARLGDRGRELLVEVAERGDGTARETARLTLAERKLL